MKRLLCLICSVNITFIRTKRAYVFNLWYQYNYFYLKDFSVSAWSIIVIRYGHSGDNVRENVFGYGLDLTMKLP